MAPQFPAEAILSRGVRGDGPNDPISTLQRRDAASRSNVNRIVVFVLAAVAGIIILIFLFRYLYARFVLGRHTYQQARNDDDQNPSTIQINQTDTAYPLSDAHGQPTSNNTNNTNAAAGVDRSTSIRSVMTLPAYRPKPTDNELVIGREGERDGIDVVVEMRTAEEEEALRDEEMEALYQIRAARRRQLAEREARREARRRAREESDSAALRELRAQTHESTARATSEIEELRSEHDRIRTARQQRSVSSVSYADIGIARADGTRVRANSTESTERVGLLSDTASIAADSLFRRRDRSASATLSIDTSLTAQHGRPESPSGLSTGGYSWGGGSVAGGRTTRSRASSAATAPRIPTPGAGSPPEIIDHEDAADVGTMAIPPPGYDEVSLDEVTPMHSRRNSDVSRPVSPYPDPPPNYPGEGPAERRMNRLSAHMEELAAQSHTQGENDAGPTATPDEAAGRPAGLRLSQVPQIVIEPSSARP
ncbi:hypothetical protein P885DRAFT_75821 [Corynascus similis CBS 632.67]